MLFTDWTTPILVEDNILGLTVHNVRALYPISADPSGILLGERKMELRKELLQEREGEKKKGNQSKERRGSSFLSFILLFWRFAIFHDHKGCMVYIARDREHQSNVNLTCGSTVFQCIPGKCVFYSHFYSFLHS